MIETEFRGERFWPSGGRRGVRVYDGPWAEWGSMPKAPIAVEGAAPSSP